MIFRRRRTEPPVTAADRTGVGKAAWAGAFTSVVLSDVLKRLSGEDRQEVLDLGPMCGETVTFLAGLSARIHVDSFRPPPPTPAKKPGEEPEDPVPLVLDYPDDAFDIVLSWEAIDFVPPDRLDDFGREVGRILRDDGVLLLFSLAKKTQAMERPHRYRIHADGTVDREEAPGNRRPRWFHANRTIERSLTGLSIKHIHLQRSQMREILAVKS